jgi:hypothetical protein
LQIRSESVIAFPRERVFATYRDELEELLPYLPNVRSIEVKERAQEGSVLRQVSVWKGGGEIPAVARAVLKEEMLAWTDHARWDEGAFVCAWRIETHAFRDAVSCRGENRFVDLGGSRTRVEIRGDMEVDASKVPGVPRLLSGTIGRTVERVLVDRIGPNLVATCVGLEKHLRRE